MSLPSPSWPLLLQVGGGGISGTLVVSPEQQSHFICFVLFVFLLAYFLVRHFKCPFERGSSDSLLILLCSSWWLQPLPLGPQSSLFFLFLLEKLLVVGGACDSDSCSRVGSVKGDIQDLLSFVLIHHKIHHWLQRIRCCLLASADTHKTNIHSHTQIKINPKKKYTIQLGLER